MTLFRHLVACNRFEPARFVPFYVGAGRIGFIRQDRLTLLARFADVFDMTDAGVTLNPSLATFEARTQALADIGERLAGEGLAPPLRHEMFPASAGWGDELLFDLDRGHVPFFGIKGYGVHLNGYVRGASGIEMWIGKRSPTKKVDPNLLDNVVAGGMSSGHGVYGTLVKEAAEEAAMSPGLVAAAKPVGAIMYRLEVPEGMRDDVLFLYDIQLDEGFEPRNTDGEFESFSRLPIEECLRLVAETDQVKFNVNLTIIDFALRHGLIGPERDDYLALLSGLRGGLIKGVI